MIRPWRRVGLAGVGLLAAMVALVGTAYGHDSRPLTVEIGEGRGDVYSVRWRVPPSVTAPNRPDVTLPSCTAVVASFGAGSGYQGRFHCPEARLGELSIQFPLFPPSLSTLVRVQWLSGETRTVLIEPGETRVSLPTRETRSGVAIQYMRLGIRHILAGYDHLLFLVCLMVIARTGKRIAVTVTGFTLAHSVTLALAALGVLSVPVAAVEAAIALSIVFLALEVARGRRDTLTYRYPIVVAGSFGLLHGFGFAAVLGETGLPQTEIPTALLFFNIGVELGQLGFVIAALVALAVCVQLIRLAVGRHRDPRQPASQVLRPLGLPLSYTVGILASFWMFERIAGFWT